MRMSLVVAVAALACGAAAVARNQEAVVPSGGPAAVDWPVYRGDPKGNQYSALAQIHAGNVHRLERAWEYKTGDANERSTMHVNPIVVNGVMYVTTASLKAVALDAATGREIWSFDPARHNNGNVVRLRNRGLVYWKGAEGERIFHFVRDRAYAVDARTGELISSFGGNGFIDLRQNLGVDPASAVIEMTSPGAVFKNVLIMRRGSTRATTPRPATSVATIPSPARSSGRSTRSRARDRPATIPGNGSRARTTAAPTPGAA